MIKTEQLLQILEKNKNVHFILDRASKLNMPNWYLGAGCISQTVWNVFHNFNPENGIKDYDLVYYDANDISYESENKFICESKELFKDLLVPVEIINEARVHIWYEKRFGNKINQYKSVEDAIKSWPTTATSIGINYINGKFKVYEPYGLDDLLNMVVRPNKLMIKEEIYKDKVERWTKIWPQLKVIPW